MCSRVLQRIQVFTFFVDRRHISRGRILFGMFEKCKELFCIGFGGKI